MIDFTLKSDGGPDWEITLEECLNGMLAHFGQPWGLVKADDHEIAAIPAMAAKGDIPVFRAIASGERLQDVPLSLFSLTATVKRHAKQAGVNMDVFARGAENRATRRTKRRQR